jgi:hypothetical protein
MEAFSSIGGGYFGENNAKKMQKSSFQGSEKKENLPKASGNMV